MESLSANAFDQNYQAHLKHLKLKGLQPKTIDAYARAIRRIGKRFDHQIDALSEQQLTDYFIELLASHSWLTGHQCPKAEARSRLESQSSNRQTPA